MNNNLSQYNYGYFFLNALNFFKPQRFLYNTVMKLLMCRGYTELKLVNDFFYFNSVAYKGVAYKKNCVVSFILPINYINEK